MHLTLEQFNQLLERNASDDQREQYTDHILECATCATHFRALNDLNQQVSQQRRVNIPLRYVLGVAAVLIMCVTPYLSEQTHPTERVQVSSLDFHFETESSPQLSVLGHVRDVNFKHNLNQWGRGTNLTDLINPEH